MGKNRLQKEKLRIAFTGGGSAGHIIPGIAVYEKLAEERAATALWLSSKKRWERDLIEQSGIRTLPISSGKLRRYFSFANFVDVFRIIHGFFESLVLLKRIKPQLLFSKGGSVSLPPVIASSLLSIPVIIHDSDYDPGLATRLTAFSASLICIPCESSRSLYRTSLRDRLQVTGNPVRKVFFSADTQRGRDFFGNPVLPILLVIGGSLGAEEINALLESSLADLCKECFVFHITGEGKASGFSHPNYRQADYLHEQLPDAVAAADLVVSRAGAGVMWELGVLGKAMLLIPKGKSGSRGDQLLNARYFGDAAAAAAVSPEKVDTEAFIHAIIGLIREPGIRRKLGMNAQALCNADGAARIARLILGKTDAL